MNEGMVEQLVANCLKSAYGIEVAQLTQLALGADMNASVYKAQAKDLRWYFVKVKRGTEYDVGARVVKRLFDAGIMQVIAPINTIQGQATFLFQGYTISVYPFIEGQNGFSQELTDSQWHSLGKALRQIHELVVPPSLKSRLRHEGYSSQWRDAVRSLYIHIERAVIGDEIATKLIAFMKQSMPAIRRLVDRAEALGQLLKNQTHTFVLCHSDIHAGNVLIEGSDSIYIVDWDDPIMAPKERDLMFIGGGVANVWNNPREETLFYSGYGNTVVNSTLMAYYRHERIVQDIAEYGNALLLTEASGEDRLEMYKQFVGMFDPRGVVDIAFKTDFS